MALIKCHECENQVSSAASSCPHCGAPVGIAATEQKGIGTPVATIQGTSKSLKIHILLAALLFWGGIVIFFVGVNTPGNAEQTGGEGPILGIFSLIIGGFWYLLTRMRIWWHHK